MISFKPCLCKIVKLTVFSNHCRRKMTMKIYNWLIFRIFMIKFFSCFITQKKILINKWFHIF